MRAWVVREYGDPAEVLEIRDVETRVPGPNEVVVDLGAASLGFADNLVCAGLYQIKPEPPFTPGFEGAGVVSSVGSAVDTVRAGQRVLALPDVGEGTLRAQTVVPEARVYPIPDDLADDQAAALFVPYQTACLALHRRARLAAGESVLIHAGAGGVGSASIQVALAAGARVFATAGGSAKVDLCRQLGAEHVIDYLQDDFVAVVKDLTDGRGVDVILDTVGGEVFDRSCRCVASEGRILVIGFAGGSPSTVQTNYLLVKNYAVMGVFYGPSPLQERLNREYHELLMGLHAQGKIDPLISKRLPFDLVPEGLAGLSDRTSYGKVVVEVGA